MKNTVRHIFPLALLFVVAFALGTLQSTKTSPLQAAAPASAQTNNVTAVPVAGTIVDPSGVMFFSKELVSQTARKGGMLYNGNPDRNYRAMFLHRDKPGEVEVHTRDTDLLYIVEGAAILATGGTTVGGKDTAPDEIRGSSMNGGVSRQVSKGDVLIIPANVSHWFKEIQTPITYVAVKVR